jgi:hypothetical protein
MYRRDFLTSGIALTDAVSWSNSLLGGQPDKADLVIDAGGHAGHGEAPSAPRSTLKHPTDVARKLLGGTVLRVVSI